MSHGFAGWPWLAFTGQGRVVRAFRSRLTYRAPVSAMRGHPDFSRNAGLQWYRRVLQWAGVRIGTKRTACRFAIFTFGRLHGRFAGPMGKSNVEVGCAPCGERPPFPVHPP